MAALQYTQYVITLPSNLGGGQLQYILNRNSFDTIGLLDTADSIYLSPWMPLVKDAAPQIADYEEGDSLITSDMAYVVLNDMDGFEGDSNGSPVAWQDCFGDGTTLLHHIFDGVTVTLTKRMLKSDSTWDYYFVGEIDAEKINWDFLELDDERSATELGLSQVRFPILSGLDRFKNTKVRDFLRVITTTDLVGKSGTPKKPYPHYGGLQFKATPSALLFLENADPKVPDIGIADKESNWNTTIGATSYDVFNSYYPVQWTGAADTLTVNGTNPFSNGDIVNLDKTPGFVFPAGLNGDTNYYVVNSVGTTFKLSLTAGGAAINITDDTPNIPGEWLSIKDTGSPANTYNKHYVFDHFAYTGRIDNISLSPHGMWGITLDKIISKTCGLTTINYGYTTPTDDEHSLAFAKATWNDTTKKYEHTFDNPVTPIDELVVSFNETFGVSPNYGFAITSIDTATNVITVSNWKTGLNASDADPFSDGDIVHVMISDTGSSVPGGLATFTDYYARDCSRASATSFTFKLSASSGGAAIDITSAGTGSQYVGNFNMKFPGSFGWDDSMSEVLKDICLYGFVLEFDVNQTGADEGKPIIKLSRRRKTEGTVPTWLNLLPNTAKENPVDNEERAVRVQYLADKDSITCPLRDEKKIYDVSLRFRIHPWSDDSGIVRTRNLQYNTDLDLWEQGQAWWQSDSPANTDANATGFNLQSDGWVGGNMFFEEKTVTTNDRFPPAWDNDALDLADTDTDYSGLYVRSKVRYRDQEVSFDSLPKLMAILLANELLLDPVRGEREYGIVASDTTVSFRSLKPRMTLDVASGAMRVTRVELNDIEGTVKIQYKTAPNMDTLDMTLPTFEGRGTTGTTGGGSSSGGGTSTSTGTTIEGFVATNPLNDLRNDVIAGTGVTVGLNLKANADGDPVELRLSSLSNLNYVSFKSPDTLTADNPYLLPTGYPASSGYVLSSTTGGTLSWVANADLSTAVILSPATANRNRILATADSVEPLAIKKRSTSTSRLLTIYDETDSVRFSVDDSFNVAIDSANFSITTDGDLSVANGFGSITQGSLGSHVLRLISTATNDDPRENFWHGRNTTTDSTTWTTLATYASTSNTGFMLFCKIIGVRTGGSSGTAQDTYSHGIIYVFKNSGGTLTSAGAITDWNIGHVAGTTVRANISGSNIQIQVTGLTNVNISWHAHIRDIAIGS